MIFEKYIKIKNYKCFGEEAQGFEKIYPINIIIGKNNSGKSSLIDLVKYAVDGNKDFITTQGKNSKTHYFFLAQRQEHLVHYTNI